MAKRNVTERVANYQHHNTTPMPPDVGTQAQFQRKKAPAIYRHDPSLAPEMEWDGQHTAREEGEALIERILSAKTLEEAQLAADTLRRMSRPFLNWAGKAERLSFSVPTLPLFVHERLSTQRILDTLRGHKREGAQYTMNLYGDPQRSIADQVLRPYEHEKWVNRLILGDSLVVMNSLLHYERLGNQVMMIYVDPPYGVKFGSNFQPFVRKRNVRHNDDDDLTREPEMVQAYRDTWELGLHSYLTYLRDRLLLARDLLHPEGSIFVQISDDNVHHVREVMDEVFGAENFLSQIVFQTTSGFETKGLATLGDFLLWYAKDKPRALGKINKLYQRQPTIPGKGNARWVLLPDGTYRGVTAAERRREVPLPEGALLYKPDNLLSQGAASSPQPFEYEGKTYRPNPNSHWKANYPEGMQKLADAGRIHVARNSIQYRRFATDFPYQERGNVWTDTLTGSFTDDKLYVVQTNTKVVERCILMATDPGDLVLDPTCGSGTTAYMAEQWGRRWITIDTSRVPLALTRQRLLTATFPAYQLQSEKLGPEGGFIYKRKQNRAGEEVGGIVPRITLRSIANDEPAEEIILVHKPEEQRNVTRVSGPFTVEATIPMPIDWEGDGVEDSGTTLSESYNSFVDRMIEILRRSPQLHLGDGKVVTFRSVRPPARALNLSAEAIVENGHANPVALVFGPENGAVSQQVVYNAGKEANAKNYHHLYVIGFAIQPNARELIENGEGVFGIPATYVQATPDLLMGDLLKSLRSSQIFSVAGMPDVELKRLRDGRYQVRLLGLDVFDPVTMVVDHRSGDDVPAWFLDSDYNDLCFYVHQAFFPRTSAWNSLKRALHTEFEPGVWKHLASAESEPFVVGTNGKVAIKVIDDRGNELLVVKSLEEAL